MAYGSDQAVNPSVSDDQMESDRFCLGRPVRLHKKLHGAGLQPYHGLAGGVSVGEEQRASNQF